MQDFQKSHSISHYFAPRGHKRMYSLGMQLMQQYLSPTDKLIGIIGDAGSGKSALIRGMFPGLELTNDDNGVYVRPLPILEMGRGFSLFTPHTYHLDIRFENGFTQMNDLADAITEAVRSGKRVIVEHFDLVYPLLGFNADLLIGVGEEVVLTRPTIFGPEPKDIVDIVYQSLPYRLMCHTAEDLCETLLPPEDLARCGHDDVKHGFVLSFPGYPPKVNLREMEARIHEMIEKNLPVTYVDEDHVNIGGLIHPCTGPRIHVNNTGRIKDFHLLYHYVHDELNDRYLIVGIVGMDNLDKLVKLEKKYSPGSVRFDQRNSIL